MVNTVMHEISFSFDQPDLVLNALLKLLQERLRQPLATKTSREIVVRNALTVLIIDAYQERAQYVGGLLTAVGYRPVIMANELDAFTSFLRGSYLPLAVVLGQEDGSNRLFVNRLIQQLVQKYDWEPLLMRLQDSRPSSFAPTVDNNPFSQAPQTFQSPMQAPQTFQGPTQAPQTFQGPMQDRSAAPMTHPLTNNNLQRANESTSWPFPDASTFPERDVPSNNPSFSRNLMSQVPSAPADFMPSSKTDPITAPPFMLPASARMQTPSGELPPVQREALKGMPEKNELPAKAKVYLDGQSLGRYQVRARLGSSDYSEVYRTYDRLREQESALKAIQVDMVPFYMMKESLEEVTVFQQEADLLGPLQHPHILPVLNCGNSYISGTNFIYKNMRFCADGSLATWVHRNGGSGVFGLKEVLPIISQLADALQFAHNYQVTYQNFKFSNIMVLNQNKKIQKLEVAFSDFSVIQDGSHFSKAPAGLAYIAPERWEGTLYPASDQYGLAAITYELLTGRPPFQGSSEHVMKILHTTKLPPPPSSLNPKLPLSVNAVLAAAMAKKPGDRFGSVALFIQTLQRC